MTKVLSEITRDALNLPAPERRKLARILLEVSDGDGDFSPEVDAAWEEEIARRLRAVEAGTAKSRPAADVFADLDRRFVGSSRVDLQACKLEYSIVSPK